MKQHRWVGTIDARCACGARRMGKRGSFSYFDSGGNFTESRQPPCTRQRATRRRMQQMPLPGVEAGAEFGPWSGRKAGK